jgi:hypothetical protein
MLYVEAEDASEFPDVFNQPALVKATQQTSGNLLLSLHDTEQSGELYRLWIVIGMDKLMEIPDFKFSVRELEDLSENQIAFLSIYRRPVYSGASSPGFSGLASLS